MNVWKESLQSQQRCSAHAASYTSPFCEPGDWHKKRFSLMILHALASHRLHGELQMVVQLGQKLQQRNVKVASTILPHEECLKRPGLP